MTIQPLQRIRDLILPLLANGATKREMLTTAIYNGHDAGKATIDASLQELRNMGYVLCRDVETGRWWLEQPGDAE